MTMGFYIPAHIRHLDPSKVLIFQFSTNVDKVAGIGHMKR